MGHIGNPSGAIADLFSRGPHLVSPLESPAATIKMAEKRPISTGSRTSVSGKFKR
jgi:hypothetical protein